MRPFMWNEWILLPCNQVSLYMMEQVSELVPDTKQRLDVPLDIQITGNDLCTFNGYCKQCVVGKVSASELAGGFS